MTSDLVICSGPDGMLTMTPCSRVARRVRHRAMRYPIHSTGPRVPVCVILIDTYRRNVTDITVQ